MDQVTQQNAALVEESAAAAESLRVQAQQLVQAVAVFKLAGDHVSARTAYAAPAPMAAPAKVERRGPHRATNVTRPTFKKKSAPAAVSATKVAPAPVHAKTGTDDWEAF